MHPRLRSTAVVAALLAAWVALPHALRDHVSDILAQAREAIGGEVRLRAVHSLSLKVDSRVIGGGVVVARNADGSQSTARTDNYVTQADIQIDVLLPDKFLLARRRGGAMRFYGVNGPRPIVSRDALPRAISSDPQMMQRLTSRQHRQFLCYIIPLLLMPPEQYAVQFTDGGQATIEGGSADVVEVNGSFDFSARLLFDTQTHRLLLMTYQEPPVRSPGTAVAHPDKAGSREGPPAGANAATSRDQKGEPLFKSLEPAGPPPASGNTQMRFSDYRPVSGIMLPFRITTQFGETEMGQIDEWRIAKLAVNPNVNPKLFEK